MMMMRDDRFEERLRCCFFTDTVGIWLKEEKEKKTREKRSDKYMREFEFMFAGNPKVV